MPLSSWTFFLILAKFGVRCCIMGLIGGYMIVVVALDACESSNSSAIKKKSFVAFRFGRGLFDASG